MAKCKLLRRIFIGLAVAVLLVPIICVSITGNGFSGITSHILLSVSLALFISAILLSFRKDDPKWVSKLCACIVLQFMLISLWT